MRRSYIGSATFSKIILIIFFQCSFNFLHLVLWRQKKKEDEIYWCQPETQGQLRAIKLVRRSQILFHGITPRSSMKIVSQKLFSLRDYIFLSIANKSWYVC